MTHTTPSAPDGLTERDRMTLQFADEYANASFGRAERRAALIAHLAAPQPPAASPEPSGAERADPDGWEANVKYLLDSYSGSIRVRPKGGDEDLIASLGVTFIKLREAAAHSREPEPAQPPAPSVAEQIAQWLEGQGQPGYAHEIRFRDWAEPRREPARPDLIEKLTYHSLERDDLTLDQVLDVLASGWKRVAGRTERQMLLQLLALMAWEPAHNDHGRSWDRTCPACIWEPAQPEQAAEPWVDNADGQNKRLRATPPVSADKLPTQSERKD